MWRIDLYSSKKLPPPIRATTTVAYMHIKTVLGFAVSEVIHLKRVRCSAFVCCALPCALVL